MNPQPSPGLNARGRFIVFEGIDGSGTTTQAKRLASALKAAKKAVHLSCEPSAGPIGTLIRQALQRKLSGPSSTPHAFSWDALALLFAADRLDHVHSVILPALEQGATVISDRYDLSSLTYQSLTAPGGSDVLPWLRQLNHHALRPDLTIVIDVTPELAAERRDQRGEQEELFEALELQRRLAREYAKAETLVPDDRLVHVPGDGTVEEVALRVLAATQQPELALWA